MYSGLSVFDLDHTLLRVNSSYRFGVYLYRQKFFSFRSLLACLGWYFSHKVLGVSLDTLHQKIFKNLFENRDLNDLKKHVNRFLDQELEKMLYRPVINRLKEAQQKGQYTLILSSSPDFIVGPIADHLVVHEWKGSFYTHDEKGHLNGIAEIIEGQKKAQYVQSVSQTLNIPLTHVTAYSDSYLDLPVLETAGRAIGVDPDRRLYRLCLKKGWEIL